MSNSPLATVKLLSPNYTANRNHVIDTLTIHCFVGQVNAKRGCEVFLPKSKGASCNYVVGFDGSIGLCVEEKHRSWCTGGYKVVNGQKVPIRVNGISGSSNDYQAITIEVASAKTEPYDITPAAMAALLDLCTDICKRNPGIGTLRWLGRKDLVGDVAQQNMTVHRWFANKTCPGNYLYYRLGEIATEVNTRLKRSATRPNSAESSTSNSATTFSPYQIRITISNLYIRTRPDKNSANRGFIDPGVYTIVSEATGPGAMKWGKLKSGVGWISLDYADKR